MTFSPPGFEEIIIIGVLLETPFSLETPMDVLLETHRFLMENMGVYDENIGGLQ